MPKQHAEHFPKKNLVFVMSVTSFDIQAFDKGKQHNGFDKTLLRGQMMMSNPIYLIGWLITATVLLSLVSLTADPVPPQAMAVTQLPA